MAAVSTIYENVLTDTTNNRTINRYRVAGGFIVEVLDTTNTIATSVFVPDPNWEWTIG